MTDETPEQRVAREHREFLKKARADARANDAKMQASLKRRRKERIKRKASAEMTNKATQREHDKDMKRPKQRKALEQKRASASKRTKLRLAKSRRAMIGQSTGSHRRGPKVKK